MDITILYHKKSCIIIGTYSIAYYTFVAGIMLLAALKVIKTEIDKKSKKYDSFSLKTLNFL